MSENIALSITGLSKDFKLPHERTNSIKERILHFRRKKSYEMLHALRDINFEVKRGEFFGIVGRNGSGKSTLLKIIGGIYQPTKGVLKVNGTLTPFIELGIGFNPELTGRDNVYLNGAILGLTKKEIEAKYKEIVDFAELEKFMDQKLKNYSSGMQVRLAFSIAIQAHNDILLIDEVLAVGDSNFQRKCFQVFNDIKKSGRTVIFVTHDMGAVQEYCDRAMMIQDGKILIEGKPRSVATQYQLANTVAAYGESVQKLQRPENPDIKISNVTMLREGKPSQHFSIKDDITGEITLRVHKSREVQVNMFVVKADGTYVAGVNTYNDFSGSYLPAKGDRVLRCTLKAGQLVKGDYTIGVGVYTPGFVPDLIDIIDVGYSNKIPHITIDDSSQYQAGQFYISGKWSEVKVK